MGSLDPQGLSKKWLGFFPYGTPAYLASLPFVSRGLFENVTPRGLFFPLEGPPPLTRQMLLLFAVDPFSPFGSP